MDAIFARPPAPAGVENHVCPRRRTISSPSRLERCTRMSARAHLAWWRRQLAARERM